MVVVVHRHLGDALYSESRNLTHVLSLMSGPEWALHSTGWLGITSPNSLGDLSL